MNYQLPVGTYWLQVWVSDTAGNTLTGIFGVQIQDTQAPVWAYEPANQLLAYGSVLSYPVVAIDLSGIDHYWINDTVNFALDANGLITSQGILSCGSYGLEIRAYDNNGHYCIAMIEIAVIDATLPGIDHPEDIEYTVGDTGNSISWNPTDDNPVSYEIWRDDTLLLSGLWNSSSETITISIDGLVAGAYVYTIIVEDYGEHTSSDSVLVRVLPATTTSTTTTSTTSTTTSSTTSTTTSTIQPPDLMSLVIGLGVGSATAVVVVVVVLLRKGMIKKS